MPGVAATPPCWPVRPESKRSTGSARKCLPQAAQQQDWIPGAAAVGSGRHASSKNSAAGLQVQVPEYQQGLGVGRQAGLGLGGIAKAADTVQQRFAIGFVGGGDRLIQVFTIYKWNRRKCWFEQMISPVFLERERVQTKGLKLLQFRVSTRW